MALKRALIAGITGQDGACLAELLLAGTTASTGSSGARDGAPSCAVDAARLRTTGWAPRIGLPDGLRATHGMPAAGRSAP